MTTTVADLAKAALRIAGITRLPGTTPSTDQYGELIPEMNRMFGSWNCDGYKIFTTSIDQYPLTSGRKMYTIGPGGDFDSARPMFIKAADLVFPTDPALRSRLDILDYDEWSRIEIQDIDGAPPWCMYYDNAFSAGLGHIYLNGQPPAGYALELYTWTKLASSFTATTDSVILPDGYEEAIVWNLGVRIAGMYPRESMLSPDARDIARRALSAVTILNSRSPVLRSEAAHLNSRSGGFNGSGLVVGGSDSGGAEVYFVISGAQTGTDGTDGNPTFTLDQVPTDLALYKNGLLMTPSGAQKSYNLSGATITFLSPQIPLVTDALVARGTA